MTDTRLARHGRNIILFIRTDRDCIHRTPGCTVYYPPLLRSVNKPSTRWSPATYWWYSRDRRRFVRAGGGVILRHTRARHVTTVPISILSGDLVPAAVMTSGPDFQAWIMWAGTGRSRVSHHRVVAECGHAGRRLNGQYTPGRAVHDILTRPFQIVHALSRRPTVTVTPTSADLTDDRCRSNPPDRLK